MRREAEKIGGLSAQNGKKWGKLGFRFTAHQFFAEDRQKKLRIWRTNFFFEKTAKLKRHFSKEFFFTSHFGGS